MSTHREWHLLLGIAALAATSGVLDVMEVDAAQYAIMARDMLASDDWTKLHYHGKDYLDKPPLHFWLAALSFKLFGVHNWSYKLPSIAFAFLAIFSTYRFTLLHHGRESAWRAALMLGTSAAFLVMTNDVRCDTILTGSVITAIWLGSAWMRQRRTWQLVGASVAVAAGMLAKGPIGLMAPALALGADLIIRRDWSILRRPMLLVAPLIVGALLTPMCLGLYEQHGLRGLHFYFWEQSFGRITGENRWKDDSTALFFTHEVLWQLLPWTLFVLLGLWHSLRSVIRRAPRPEYASIGGATLVFIALSMSRFKLPHYLYVIAPLFAVIGAQAWSAQVLPRWLRWSQSTLLTMLAAAAVLLSAWCFRHPAWPVPLLAFGLIAWRMRALGRREPGQALFIGSMHVWIVAGLTLNVLVYPAVLRYQVNATAGRWAAERRLEQGAFHGLQAHGPALDLYAGYPVPWLSDAGEARDAIREGVVIYTDAEHYRELLDSGLVPRAVDSIPSYSVQMLSLDFVLPDSRAAVVEHRYLLQY